MATMTLRDDALRAKHIVGDPEIVRRIRALAPQESIVLRIEGRPLRFRRMSDREEQLGETLEADPASARDWRALLQRRGETVSVELETRSSADPYLLSLSATLTEWNSPEDAQAYDGL